jgi:hypothetical protein
LPAPRRPVRLTATRSAEGGDAGADHEVQDAARKRWGGAGADAGHAGGDHGPARHAAFHGGENEDGSGYTISTIEDEAGGSAVSVDRVRAIWHRFADHLEAAPEPEIFGVFADWRG